MELPWLLVSWIDLLLTLNLKSLRLSSAWLTVEIKFGAVSGSMMIVGFAEAVLFTVFWVDKVGWFRIIYCDLLRVKFSLNALLENPSEYKIFSHYYQTLKTCRFIKSKKGKNQAEWPISPHCLNQLNLADLTKLKQKPIGQIEKNRKITFVYVKGAKWAILH